MDQLKSNYIKAIKKENIEYAVESVVTTSNTNGQKNKTLIYKIKLYQIEDFIWKLVMATKSFRNILHVSCMKCFNKSMVNKVSGE